MKKTISLLLCILMLLSAVGCKKEKYPEVESTAEEARVMVTFKLDEEKYEMKYELYRALFLNFSENYDNGNKDFWDSPESVDELTELNEKILEYALDIFSTLHIAKKIGFDPYSKDAENKIAEYIETSVEGDGDTITGFGGDYEAYLASLKASNINYSVQKLLLRYSIAYDKIIEHYEGVSNENNPTENEEGAISATREDVLNFYNSDSAVRVSPITINATYITYNRANEIRNSIASAEDSSKALNIAIGSTASIPGDILNGIVIGTHSLDSIYYRDITEAALGLGENETSEVIYVVTDAGKEYWILYGRDKNTEHFENNYEYIKSVYISQKIGEIIDNTKKQLKDSLTETDAYKTLKHSDISMK